MCWEEDSWAGRERGGWGGEKDMEDREGERTKIMFCVLRLLFVLVSNVKPESSRIRESRKRIE